MNPANYNLDRKAEASIVYVSNDNTVPPPPVTQLVTRDMLYLQKPDLVRRVKPKDLFRYATPYRVDYGRIHFNDAKYTQKVDSSLTRIETGPASYWAREVEPPINFGFVQSDFGLLDQKLRNRIKEQKVDLLSAVAELSKTASLVTDLADDIMKMFRHLSRDLPLHVVKRMLANPRTRYERQLANRWLSYSFGLKPTLQDIYGTAEAAVVKLNEGVPAYEKTHSRKRVLYPIEQGLVRGTVEVTTLMKVKVRYQVRSWEQMKLAQLGILNPLAFLWQIAPWSFAVDWCIDIGGFLESLDALVGIHEIYVQRSGGRDMVYRQGIPILESEHPDVIVGYKAVRQRLGVTDDLSMGWPKPKGIFETGNLGNRLANMTALLTQIVSPKQGRVYNHGFY